VPVVGKEVPIRAGTLQALASGLTSMVDVVDPERGTVIYSQAFGEPPRQFIADGLAYGYREDAVGNPRIELVSVQFSSRR
jgi:hypothetical protein